MATAAWGQHIDIRTPQLPPRGAAAPGAGDAVGTPTGQPPQPGDWSAAPAAPGYGGAAQGRGGYGGGPAVQGAVGAAAGGVASPMQQQRRGGSPQPGYGSTAAPQVAMVAPTASAPGGTCRVQPSPDRQSVSLLGPDGLPRRHVGLGEFRVQRVVHSPDGRWAVAVTKLRGEPQYAAMALDLARCETVHTIELPDDGSDVVFETESARVRTARGERQLQLADPRVR
jgi:hypothetical protein